MRSTVGVLPSELQLAWEPAEEPEVSVEVFELAIDVFVSELRVRVSANFSGGVGTRAVLEKTESVSLS